MKPVFRVALLIAVVLVNCSCGETQITRLAPGTVVNVDDTQSSNRAVLVARPRIATGDVDHLGAAIRDAVSRFRLVIMTRVTSEQADDLHQLEHVGVGYAVPIERSLTIVTVDSASRLGAKLGLIESRVLSENESQLANIEVLVQTNTLTLFDVPAIFHRDGRHVDRLMRHLVWIHAKTGRPAMATWLLEKDQNGSLASSRDPLRVSPARTKEDRKIHVDGNAFFLGIPSERAFALVDLPPGFDIKWDEPLKRLASRRQYKTPSLLELSRTLNERILRKQAAKSLEKELTSQH
ncbi:MAG: hypothetical protein AAGA03_03400 [Planctomycetota bacterium]